MLLAATYMIRDALMDASTGVNAKIPDVPLRSGHDQPRDVADVVTVFDNENAARFQAPDDWPALIVGPDAAFQVEGEAIQERRDSITGVPVGVRYSTREGEFARAKREGAYTIRAAAMSVRELAETEAGSTKRQALEVQLLTAGEWTMGPLDERRGQGTNTAGLVVTFRARDLKP